MAKESVGHKRSADGQVNKESTLDPSEPPKGGVFGCRKRRRGEAPRASVTVDYEGLVTESFPEARIYILDSDVPVFAAFCSGVLLKVGQFVRLGGVHPVYLREQLRGLAMCSRSSVQNIQDCHRDKSQSFIPLAKLPDRRLIFRCPKKLSISRYVHLLEVVEAISTAWGALRNWGLENLTQQIERAVSCPDAHGDCGVCEKRQKERDLVDDEDGRSQVVDCASLTTDSWDPDNAVEFQAVTKGLDDLPEAAIPLCLAVPETSKEEHGACGQPPVWLLSFGAPKGSAKARRRVKTKGGSHARPSEHVWLGEVLLLFENGTGLGNWTQTKAFLESACWAQDACDKDDKAPVPGYRLFFLVLENFGRRGHPMALALRHDIIHINASRFVAPPDKYLPRTSTEPPFTSLSKAMGEGVGTYSVWGVIRSSCPLEGHQSKTMLYISEDPSELSGEVKMFVEWPKWFDFCKGWTQGSLPAWMQAGYVVGFTDARLCQASEKGGKMYWRARRQFVHLLGYQALIRSALLPQRPDVEGHVHYSESIEIPIGMQNVRNRRLLEDPESHKASPLWEIIKPDAADDGRSLTTDMIRVRVTIVKIKICKVWIACPNCRRRLRDSEVSPGFDHGHAIQFCNCNRAEKDREPLSKAKKKIIRWEASAEIEDGTAKVVVYADGSSALALATGLLPEDRNAVEYAKVKTKRSSTQKQLKRSANMATGMQSGLSNEDVERLALLENLEELLEELGHVEYRSVQKGKYLSFWPNENWGTWTSAAVEKNGRAEAILAKLCNREFAGRMYHMFLTPMQKDGKAANYELRKNVQMDGHVFNSLCMPLAKFRAGEIAPARSVRDNAYGILQEILAHERSE